MAKPRPISGFLELLPEQKLAEDRLISAIREVYELHGFLPIETPAVELVSTLASKGVVDREIYVVKRLHADEEEEADLGLHFDLTVPFARYVAQHFSKLHLPFKRYQLQKVWRGERPQKGRFREFYQFDIDIIAREDLPIACDAEIINMLLKAFEVIKAGSFSMLLNSRKVLYGAYEACGVAAEAMKATIIAVDKLSKIGAEGVGKELIEGVGLLPDVADRILNISSAKCSLGELEAWGFRSGVGSALFQEGLRELESIGRLIRPELRSHCMFDMSLARGLDYYTGVVFEVKLTEHPEFGTVASGGRYDDLASQFINQKLPGVGGSIGLTRLIDLLLSKGKVETNKRSTADALISVLSEEQRSECNQVAEVLRSLGIGCDVYYKSPKLGKQIDYAAQLGMRYVLFLSPEGGKIEVKDLQTKQQSVVEDLAKWCASVKSQK